MNDVQREVVRVIAEHLDLQEDEVITEATFIGDLGAEALDLVEILDALQAHFNVEIDDNEADQIADVGDLVATIERKLG